MNNKVLLFIFIGLVAVLGISKIITGEDESSFNPVIIDVEAESVTKVVLHAKADEFAKAVLEKNGDQWTIELGKNKYQAAAESVQQLLTNLANVKTSYIAAKDAEKWSAYELGDDQASHVQVYGNNKILADFYVGKFSVNQQAQQLTSFFRLNGQNSVYAVQGMAGMMLGQGTGAYRDKKILNLDIAQIESLEYDGEQVYKVEKEGNHWLLNGDVMLDTNKVKNFVMNLRTMNGESFVNDFDEVLHTDKLLKKLTINGRNMAKPVTVRCWMDEAKGKPFIIQSSQFPDSYFSSDSTRLFTRIFKPVSDW